MNYIRTPLAVVEFLQSEAKALVKAGQGKHVDMLDRAARSFGYFHWHHVLKNHEFFEGFHGPMKPSEHSGHIALGINDDRRGCQMIKEALATGQLLSTDRRHLLFEHPPESDDCDVNGHLGEAEDYSGRIKV